MKDFIAEMGRKQAELDASDSDARAAGEIVGRYITHAYADGAAVYRIVNATTRSATIEKVDIGDGWTLPAWGQKTTLSRKKVEGFLRQRDAMSAIFGRNDDWWASTKLGSVVHYRKVPGAFVRGTVVDADGERKMRVTALVGSWARHEVWTRMPNGGVCHGTYPLWIREGHVMQPNEVNMYGSPSYRADGHGDPATMPALELDPPPPSPEIEALVEASTFHGLVAARLEDVATTMDTVASRDAYLAALDGVRELLATRPDLTLTAPSSGSAPR